MNDPMMTSIVAIPSTSSFCFSSSEPHRCVRDMPPYVPLECVFEGEAPCTQLQPVLPAHSESEVHLP